MRVALASLDPTLGAFEENVDVALALARKAKDELAADLIVYPAYALCGAPIAGLAACDAFVQAARDAADAFAAQCPIDALISTLAGEGDAEFALNLGALVAQQQGMRLPEMDAHDFARNPEVFHVHGNVADPLGLCGWDAGAIGHAQVGDSSIAVFLDRPVSPDEVPDDADLFVMMLAQPCTGGVGANDGEAEDLPLSLFEAACAESGRSGVYVNLLGSQDGAVFDGRVAAYVQGAGGGAAGARGGDAALRSAPSADGAGLIELGRFSPGIACVDLAPSAQERSSVRIDTPAPKYPKCRGGRERQLEADWKALVLSLGDYMRKNGFSDCVIGLSGGIDSTVTALLACDAVGAEHVHGVLMPGPYSSQSSVSDAAEFAGNMGISTSTVPITPAFKALCESLAGPLGGEVAGLTRENMQARIRTVLLMAFSNAHGWMLVNTGNKSEAAMGYSTLYGDTAGAFAPLGDVYKTRVYALAEWRDGRLASHDGDSKAGKIPNNVFEKPPSAELAPGQRDDDRLPPYDVLDPLLMSHIEGGLDGAQLVEAGFDAALVANVLQTVRRFEFKRRGEPMCARISPVPFDIGRNWPVTNAWVDDCGK